MRLGIAGLPGSGKTTVFEALTRNISDSGNKMEHRIGIIRVPDNRVDFLSKRYQPEKTTYAQIEYFLPGKSASDKKKEQSIWNSVRDCDAIIYVIRNFGGYGFDAPKPYDDYMALSQDMILADFMIVQKRIEKIEADRKRSKSTGEDELVMLNECLSHLENETPIRKFEHLANAPQLKGFGLVSAKPILVLFNNEDDDEVIPDIPELATGSNCMVIRGKLEQELAQMSEDEANDFLTEFNISESATDRAIRMSYEILGAISFFTAGEREVRAWTIRKDTSAVDAAETIHSDFKKGFIRAEVLAYQDFVDAGSFAEARKRGTVRLEGKTYIVQDADIITFRFNV